jgi:multidrug efflux pump subunit AcrB
MRGPFGIFFAASYKVFDVATKGYVKTSASLVSEGDPVAVVVAVVVVWCGRSLAAGIPAGFVPEEDQGIVGVGVPTPPWCVAAAHGSRS